MHRAAKLKPSARRAAARTPKLRRQLRSIATGMVNGLAPKKTSTSINIGELRERWGNLIIQELHAHIVTQISDAATLAGIKPHDLTRRLIRQLQK
jgi:hypothetical protein